MNESKQTLSIPVAIIIAGALIAFGIYWTGRGTNPGTASNTQPVAASNVIQPISAKDHVLGDPKAKITLVVYSDFECPFCKQFHQTLNELMALYGPKKELAIAFRHFPVHQNSIAEGAAAECAAELGGTEAFWKYSNLVFEKTTSNNGLDLALLPTFASQIGLDVTKFNSCLSSKKYEERIIKDRNDVANAGAEGTPYSVIFAGDQKIPLTQGALPFADMKNIIDTVLKNI